MTIEEALLTEWQASIAEGRTQSPEAHCADLARAVEQSAAMRAMKAELREEGAKHMRDSIEAYLAKHGVPHPPLPRTLGERKQFERDWDRRVAEGAAR